MQSPPYSKKPQALSRGENLIGRKVNVRPVGGARENVQEPLRPPDNLLDGEMPR